MTEDRDDGLLIKSELAKAFGVSTTTIDNWIRKGCPCVEKGSNGKPWKFNLAEVARWRELKARRSAQQWCGRHIRPGNPSSSPALTALLEERPDLHNGIRFFVEDGLSNFLLFWVSSEYPEAILKDLHIATGSETFSTQLLKIIVMHLFNGASKWILDDTYNNAGGGQLDEAWGAVTGQAIATSPPTEPNSLLIARALPSWLDLPADKAAEQIIGGNERLHINNQQREKSDHE